VGERRYLYPRGKTLVARSRQIGYGRPSTEDRDAWKPDVSERDQAGDGAIPAGGARRLVASLLKKLRACLISELYKAWPESQALASHSQALEDSCLCLIQLHQMIQAQQRT
jgi:hypothetical protein